MMTFFQNAINFVAQLIRIMNQILYEHISKIVFLFLNDVDIKNFKIFLFNMKKCFSTFVEIV